MSNLRRSMMMAGRGGGEDPYISYQVYATAGSTRAVFSGALNAVAKMFMGDVEITPVSSMTFATAGYYDFKILLVNPATIPDAAFNAGHYHNVVLPASVTYIGLNAFRNYSTNASSSTLTSLATTPPQLNGDPFANRHIITLKVPADSLTAYQTAWSMMSNIVAI